MLAGDFRLTFKAKLVPDTAGAALHFRAESAGRQAGLGQDRWGKLADETGRPLAANPAAPQVKAGDWNDYEIVAQGSRLRTLVNGKPCTELDDVAGPRRGIFALRLPATAPAELRIKELRLEVNPPASLPKER
jgi:hypothetical protein